MDSVTQKHPMSCGLACVAFLTHTPYDEVIKGEPPAKLNQVGFYCPELTAKLKQLGHQYTWKKLPESERDNEFNVGDIVFIDPSDSHRHGHFLVKSSQGWMDPWINLDYPSLNLAKAQSGFRDKLPGRASYLVYKVIKNTSVSS